MYICTYGICYVMHTVHWINYTIVISTLKLSDMVSTKWRLVFVQNSFSPLSALAIAEQKNVLWLEQSTSHIYLPPNVSNFHTSFVCTKCQALDLCTIYDLKNHHLNIKDIRTTIINTPTRKRWYEENNRFQKKISSTN